MNTGGNDGIGITYSGNTAVTELNLRKLPTWYTILKRHFGPLRHVVNSCYPASSNCCRRRRERTAPSRVVRSIVGETLKQYCASGTRINVFVSNNYKIRYDTIAEFNVDSKAECDQLNLAHETKTNKRQCRCPQKHKPVGELARALLSFMRSTRRPIESATVPIIRNVHLGVRLRL